MMPQHLLVMRAYLVIILLLLASKQGSLPILIGRALKERAPKSGAPGARSYFEELSLERAPFENTGAEAGARSYF